MPQAAQGHHEKAKSTSHAAHEAAAPEFEGLGVGTAAASVLALQRVAGNQAIGQLLRSRGAASPLVLQREIDTSPSPFLPKYEQNETPGWKEDQGVPEWAKEEYKKGAKKVLICSMTDDRKIGSVYFEDGSRIRTTHGAGPAKEKHQGMTTLQFNIDEDKAIKAYMAAKRKQPTSWDEIYLWTSLLLKGKGPDDMPDWASPVKGPDTVPDVGQGAPQGDLKLFEIFTKVSGELKGWHPSRGTAVKFETDKQVISVLEAGIEAIKDIKEAKARNEAFYTFVEKRLPNFVQYIRKPTEV